MSATTSSKTEPTVVEDFLDEDTEIPGQRYVLLSFLSPEKVLDKKELYFFEKFLQSYEVDWKIKNLEKYLVDVVKNINDQLDDRARELEKQDQPEQAAICRRNRVNIEALMTNYQTFVQKNKTDINKTKIKEAYDDFMYANKSKLEEEYYAKNEFRTTVRGLKVRGVYGNPKEAELKAKKLQSKDKYHNIFVGDVGKWLPWDPQPHDIAEQEYGQDQLNTLMRKYKENEDNRDKYFEERAKGAKKVFGGSGAEGGAGGAGASETFGSMFGSSGDLAMQRKLEKPSISIEKVEDGVSGTTATAAATATNTVVEGAAESKSDAPSA
jgi:hypothetical protein